MAPRYANASPARPDACSTGKDQYLVMLFMCMLDMEIAAGLSLFAWSRAIHTYRARVTATPATVMITADRIASRPGGCWPGWAPVVSSWVWAVMLSLPPSVGAGRWRGRPGAGRNAGYIPGMPGMPGPPGAGPGTPNCMATSM
jgi:hypothetical protein